MELQARTREQTRHCKISCDSLAKSGSFGGMLRSRHRRVLFIFIDTESARTPAISMSKLPVRSRWMRLLASGRNSARAIAPSDERSVEFRKTRLRFELMVMAARRVVICTRCGRVSRGEAARRLPTHAFQSWSAAGVETHVEGFERRIELLLERSMLATAQSPRASTHQSFGDGHETLHVDLVLAEVEDLQRTVPLEHLSDVGDTILRANRRIRRWSSR